MQSTAKKDVGAPMRTERPIVSLNDGRGDNPENGLFRSKPLSEAIKGGKDAPPMHYLYPELLRETEVSIFFGPTGKGKTIFAFQMADHVARHYPEKRVLVLDCEMSERNIARRFPNYEAPSNLYRAEFNPDSMDFDNSTNYDDRVMGDLEKELVKVGADVVIIDNISYLRTDTERAKDANSFLRTLKNLCVRLNLTALVIAHTPKRDETRPMVLNDLMGSSRLAHFVDQLFAIGVSRRDPGIRYIKQVKDRHCDEVYHSENVLLLEATTEGGWLHFNIIGNGSESEQLAEPSDMQRSERDDLIMSFKKSQPGMSYQDIVDGVRSRGYECSKSTVKRVLDKQEQVERGIRR